MKMFSDCSGPCEDCITHYTGGCLAGHGDDDFRQINLSEAKRIIANGWMKDQHMMKRLLEKYPELRDPSDNTKARDDIHPSPHNWGASIKVNLD